jgi:HPt (histidine-containing phosphotransfer) domain-containing protein
MTPRATFGPDRVLDDLGGDRRALAAMIDAYLSQLGPATDSIRAAHRASDLAELVRQVHRLRGAFTVLRAEAALHRACELEDWLDAQHLPPAELVERVLAESRRLAAALRAWLPADPI